MTSAYFSVQVKNFEEICVYYDVQKVYNIYICVLHLWKSVGIQWHKCALRRRQKIEKEFFRAFCYVIIVRYCY
jgi:hypothetical protein